MNACWRKAFQRRGVFYRDKTEVSREAGRGGGWIGARAFIGAYITRERERKRGRKRDRERGNGKGKG